MKIRMARETMRVSEKRQEAAKSDFKGIEQAHELHLKSRERKEFNITWIQGPSKVTDTI